jgi:signal peptidase II
MVLDQISKQWIVKNLQWFEVRPVLPNLSIVHHRNTGAAFSMFNQAPQAAFVLLGVAVSVGILWWLRKNPRGQPLLAIGLTLIMGGALGNVIDRVSRGHVVDFIDFHVGTWHYATFNIADSAISVGAALLVLDMLLDWRRQRQARSGPG